MSGFGDITLPEASMVADKTDRRLEEESKEEKTEFEQELRMSNLPKDSLKWHKRPRLVQESITLTTRQTTSGSRIPESIDS